MKTKIIFPHSFYIFFSEGSLTELETNISKYNSTICYESQINLLKFESLNFIQFNLQKQSS